MAGEVSDALRRTVADRAYHVCEYCLVHEEDLYHGCEVDHVISVKHGGLAAAQNHALVALHCKRHKCTILGTLCAPTPQPTPLYNPRAVGSEEKLCLYRARVECSTGYR